MIQATKIHTEVALALIGQSVSQRQITPYKFPGGRQEAEDLTLHEFTLADGRVVHEVVHLRSYFGDGRIQASIGLLEGDNPVPGTFASII